MILKKSTRKIKYQIATKKTKYSISHITKKITQIVSNSKTQIATKLKNSKGGENSN